MNKYTRAFVMTGVAVAAGLTMAAGPATASPAPAGDDAKMAKKPVAAAQQAKVRDRIVRFYESPRTCHKYGKMGVWKRDWNRYECFQVWRGFHRGDWALKVYYGPKFQHGQPGFPHKPGFPQKPGFPHKPGPQGPGWKH
ncbi:hypothetical protein [Actinoplanes sp. GCM10030250]|uniref:hypothetical protein n=1 Tax=Actinoplanes sp. GCM10030250 TaxID=3273376 RepID=UPI003616ECF5